MFACLKPSTSTMVEVKATSGRHFSRRSLSAMRPLIASRFMSEPLPRKKIGISPCCRRLGAGAKDPRRGTGHPSAHLKTQVSCLLDP